MDMRLGYEWREGVAVIEMPGSKSVAARALVRAYVMGYDTKMHNLPDCDDTQQLAAALAQLRSIYPDARSGPADEKEVEAIFNLGAGGTSVRFFMALAASLPGLTSYIVCDEAMARRPIKPLVDKLRELGASIEPASVQGKEGWKVVGRTLVMDEVVGFESNVSSQFLSAMMLVGPLWEGAGCFNYSSTQVSKSYIEMTSKVCEEFLEKVDEYFIEGDWSAAAFFYEYVLLSGKSVILRGLQAPEQSKQGDSAIAEIMGRVGVTTELLTNGDLLIINRQGGFPTTPQNIDLSSTPDLAPPLAFCFCLSGIPFSFSGVGHLRHKESDRLHSLEQELTKVECKLLIGEDTLDSRESRVERVERVEVEREERVDRGKRIVFDAWGDHRMAMAEAMAATRLGEVGIQGAECVSKSFPDFFKVIETLGIKKI